MTMANIVMSFKLPLKQTGVRKLKQKISLQQISFTPMCIKNPAKNRVINFKSSFKKVSLTVNKKLKAN